jgi:hypothetical protein
MKKLKLEIDALAVESFDTFVAPDGEGTVRGLESYPNGCFPPSGSVDPAIDSCAYATCAGDTCWQSCNGTCNCGGSAGCPQESAGYTYCFRDPSCLNQCFPTGGQPTCFC